MVFYAAMLKCFKKPGAVNILGQESWRKHAVARGGGGGGESGAGRFLSLGARTSFSAGFLNGYSSPCDTNDQK